MAVTEQSAPYAPSTLMLMLLERNRDKGLPNPITTDVLLRLGVTASLVQRTFQALKTLDLIGEDGKHTGTLDTLRRAPEADYQRFLSEWLKAAYEHTLDVLDPATATEVQIRDAFRHYNPVSLQPRMIKLFTSLFEAAGVRSPSEAKAAAKRPAATSASRPAARAMRPPPRSQSHTNTDRKPPPTNAHGIHPALAGLLSSLPMPEVGWTKDDRDRFMTAFGVLLDFAYPPGLRAPSISAEADEADA